MKKSTKKGFTLAELLIVIAIIAVLIAIMFPVFGAQLNKARAAAELANVRAKYSELVADAMLGSGDKLNDANATGKVEIQFSALQAAETYGDKTFITISKNVPDKAFSADSTEDVTVSEADSKLYVVVSYESYFGYFEVDPDVTIKVKN